MALPVVHQVGLAAQCRQSGEAWPTGDVACTGVPWVQQSRSTRLKIAPSPPFFTSMITLAAKEGGVAAVFQMDTMSDQDYYVCDGDWVVRLNVTIGDAFVKWSETHVCVVDYSGCTGTTSLGSLTGQSITLSTGVHDMTVPCVGVPDEWPDADSIWIGAVFGNTDQQSQRSVQVKFDQAIDTQIYDVPCPTGVVHSLINNQPLASLVNGGLVGC